MACTAAYVDEGPSIQRELGDREQTRQTAALSTKDGVRTSAREDSRGDAGRRLVRCGGTDGGPPIPSDVGRLTGIRSDALYGAKRGRCSVLRRCADKIRQRKGKTVRAWQRRGLSPSGVGRNVPRLFHSWQPEFASVPSRAVRMEKMYSQHIADRNS